MPNVMDKTSNKIKNNNKIILDYTYFIAFSKKKNINALNC